MTRNAPQMGGYRMAWAPAVPRTPLGQNEIPVTLRPVTAFMADIVTMISSGAIAWYLTRFRSAWATPLWVVTAVAATKMMHDASRL